SGRSSALITGAAEGIGRALALRFAAGGYDVIGVDCNESGLAETARLVAAEGRRFSPVIADLAAPSLVADLRGQLEAWAPFDVVIHNAGINRFGRFASADMETQERVATVNLTAPILLMRELFARRMLVVNARLGFVSSLSHFVGYPGAAVYAATKS